MTGPGAELNKPKLTILAALLHKPRVLIADEPIVGLDPESAITTRQIFSSFAERGGAVLLCTHTLGFAEAVCHRVGLLSAGVLVQEGDLATLRKAAGLPDASLETLYLHLSSAAATRTASATAAPAAARDFTRRA